MLGKLLKRLVPPPPTFEVFAGEIIRDALKGAPNYALKKLYLFQKRLLPTEQDDPYTFGRVHLLESILHSINSRKLGVAEPLQKAKNALLKTDRNVSLEMAAICELERFLNDDFSGYLISNATSVGKWLSSFRVKDQITR